jgi:hypothetical protein
LVHFVAIILGGLHMLSWRRLLDLPLVICIYVVVMPEMDAGKKKEN